MQTLKGMNWETRWRRKLQWKPRRSLESELSAATTLKDVKAAAKESSKKKWQERWVKATGRDLFAVIEISTSLIALH